MFDFLIVIGSIIDVILSEIDVSIRPTEPSRRGGGGASTCSVHRNGWGTHCVCSTAPWGFTKLETPGATSLQSGRITQIAGGHNPCARLPKARAVGEGKGLLWVV